MSSRIDLLTRKQSDDHHPQQVHRRGCKNQGGNLTCRDDDPGPGSGAVLTLPLSLSESCPQSTVSANAALSGETTLTADSAFNFSAGNSVLGNGAAGVVMWFEFSGPGVLTTVIDPSL